MEIEFLSRKRNFGRHVSDSVMLIVTFNYSNHKRTEKKIILKYGIKYIARARLNSPIVISLINDMNIKIRGNLLITPGIYMNDLFYMI